MKRVEIRDGEEQKFVSNSSMQYTVVATLLPSFDPRSASPFLPLPFLINLVYSVIIAKSVSRGAKRRVEGCWLLQKAV